MTLQEKTLIESRLEQLIPERGPLSEAIRYALLGPGKRFRPLLVLASAKTFGVPVNLALDPACALEMIHAFSLIHDDLPCMDNDDYRRGRPSLHRAFPEAIALLAGDALLSEAFLVLSRCKSTAKAQLIETLATRIGTEGMIGGQVLDMAPIGASLEQILEMQRKKTGDLFSSALEFGPILAEQGGTFQEEMRQIGLHLGVAYQIQDDLDDAKQKSDESKPTLLALLGKDEAYRLLEQSFAAIEKILKRLPEGAPALSILLTKLKIGTGSPAAAG